MSRIRLRIQADNAIELVGGGLLIAGIAIVVGLGAALLAAAFVCIMLAEFSWSGKVWSVPLPKSRKDRKKNRADRKALRAVRKAAADNEESKKNAGL